MQLEQARRIQQQIMRAANETSYYGDLFASAGLKGERLRRATLNELPVTPKSAIRAQPEAFVCAGSQPTLCTMTTGTTGQGTATFITLRESQIFSLMSAQSMMRQGLVSSPDIVQVSTSSRALLGNQTFMDACRHTGALVYQSGVVDPVEALKQLSHEHRLPGKKGRASLLYTYPSYLGRLIEAGLELGYSPSDFGLERIIVGGEVSSPGLRQRSEELFGPLPFGEGYGISEVWPFGGAFCEVGHLHFDRLRGHMEVLAPDSDEPVQPGGAGRLVLTPFFPYREASIILRYDTGDLVRTLIEPCTCSLNHSPAVSTLIGKQRFCVQTTKGWFGPRDILNVLEPMDAVPLPVRCELRAMDNALDLTVVVREATDALHRTLTDRFELSGIPLKQLRLAIDPTQLEQPLPWRGDLHELSY
jgi:phenylacetate-CoA ligase